MGIEFENKIVLEGCRKQYREYGPATGILCWVYDVLGELYLIRLSGLMGSKADSRTDDPRCLLFRLKFGSPREHLTIQLLWVTARTETINHRFYSLIYPLDEGNEV